MAEKRGEEGVKWYQQILTRNDCYRAGQTIVPVGVMVHSTGANNPRLSRYVPGNEEIGWNTGGNHWDRSGTGACVHAFLGKMADGSVGVVQTLPWNMRGWHCGRGSRGSANDTHISFELCEDGLEDADYFGKVYQTAVELTADLCRQYGLDPAADGVVICHSEGYARGVASNHADVMHWFPKFGKNMDTFRADVVQAMKGEKAMTEEQVRAIVREELAAQEARRAAEPADDWAKPYIETAIQAGILDGVEDGQGGITIARPKSNPTREEMATMGVALLRSNRS